MFEVAIQRGENGKYLVRFAKGSEEAHKEENLYYTSGTYEKGEVIKDDLESVLEYIRYLAS